MRDCITTIIVITSTFKLTKITNINTLTCINILVNPHVFFLCVEISTELTHSFGVRLIQQVQQLLLASGQPSGCWPKHGFVGAESCTGML